MIIIKNSPKYLFRTYRKVFYEIKNSSTQNDQKDHYNRYQYTHRSSSNDQNKASVRKGTRIDKNM